MNGAGVLEYVMQFHLFRLGEEKVSRLEAAWIFQSIKGSSSIPKSSVFNPGA